MTEHPMTEHPMTNHPMTDHLTEPFTEPVVCR